VAGLSFLSAIALKALVPQLLFPGGISPFPGAIVWIWNIPQRALY
jgi:hypothetical protein